MPAVSAPSLTTLPVAPWRRKVAPPAMKSALSMAWVVATSAPTSAEAVGLKYTPLGLLRKTWPLAVMRPWIWLAWVSSTRLRVTEVLLGWTKSTRALAPTLKVCQSSAPCWVAWVTVMVAPCWPIVTAPPTTWPPVGNCVVDGGVAGAGGAAACAMPAAAAPANSAASSLPRPLCLPRPRVFSATATQAPRVSLQTKRYKRLMVACPLMVFLGDLDCCTALRTAWWPAARSGSCAASHPGRCRSGSGWDWRRCGAPTRLSGSA